MITNIDSLAGVWLSQVPAMAVKSLLVLGAAFLALRALPRLAASTRFLIVFYALGATLLMPVLAATLPGWHVVPNWFDAAPPSAVTAALPAQASPVSPSTAPRASTNGVAQRANRESTTQTVMTYSTAAILMGVWLVGMMILALRASYGSWRLATIRAQAGAVGDARWQMLLHDCASALGVAHPPQLRVHPESIMPVTLGVREPVILLPLEAMDWNDQRKKEVLLHELAHIRRADLMSEWVGVLACTVQWFNPFVWWAHRSMIIERERACDDMVLGTGADPSHYADCLLKTAVECRSMPAPCPGMARPSDLETRLVSVLDGSRRRTMATRVVEATLIAAVLSVVIPVATLASAEDAVGRITAVDSAGDTTPGTDDLREIDRLRTALRSADANVRAEAREELEQLGRGHRVVTGLSARLFSEDSSDSSVLRKYSSIYENAQSARTLLNSLNSAFAIERAAAAQALSGYAGVAVAQALAAALGDENWHVREWSARSLGNVGDPGAVPALVTTLVDEQPAVREWSARALGNIRHPDAVDGLLQSLADTSSDVREWSARALGDIGSERAIDGLVSALQDSSNDVREWSARALGNIGSSSAVDGLINALQDPSDDVREWSVRALGDIGDPRARDAIAALGNDRDADVREWSERVLDGMR